MKKRKKVLALLLCAGMMMTYLSGCGNEENELVKFEVWSHNSHSKAVFTEMVEEWNETEGKRLGVEVVYTVKEGNIQQAVEMAFASDQEPDMFTSCNVEKYSASGDIVPITTLPGGEEFVQKYADKGIDMTKSTFSDANGYVYCVPFATNTFGLVYNKDMFKKYGIVDENGEPTPPKTFAEVREYAKRMTNPQEQDYGIILPMKWSGFVGTDIEQLSMGSTGFMAYNPLEGKYDFSVFKPIYEMYLGIKEDRSYFPGPEALDNDTARAYFSERNIGMKFAGSYDVGVFNSQFPAKCDWGVAPYPVEEAANRYYQYMMVGGNFALSKQAVEKVGEETAFEIFKFFHSDELLQNLYQKGMSLPYDYTIVEGIEVDEGLKGWEEFSKLTTISTASYDLAKTDLAGMKDSNAVFIEDLWTGEKTVDEAVADLNERYNAAMQSYYDNNQTADFSKTLKSEWNIKLDSAVTY